MSKLLVLAQNSAMPSAEVLGNTGAGIVKSSTYRRMEKIRLPNGRNVELVFRNGGGESTIREATARSSGIELHTTSGGVMLQLPDHPHALESQVTSVRGSVGEDPSMTLMRSEHFDYRGMAHVVADGKYG